MSLITFGFAENDKVLYEGRQEEFFRTVILTFIILIDAQDYVDRNFSLYGLLLPSGMVLGYDMLGGHSLRCEIVDEEKSAVGSFR